MLDFCEVPMVLWILNKSKIISMCIFCAHMLFRFSPNMLQCIIAEHLHLGLICSTVIVLEVLRVVQMQLCKLNRAAIIFLDGRSFSNKPSILVP